MARPVRSGGESRAAMEKAAGVTVAATSAVTTRSAIRAV
jgi:hypothetical protein